MSFRLGRWFLLGLGVALVLTLALPLVPFKTTAQRGATKAEGKVIDLVDAEPARLDLASTTPNITQSETGKDDSIRGVMRDAPAAAYSNPTAITITDCPSPCPASGQAASLYPSPITVAGEVGVVQRVSVTLNGLTHSFPSDVDMLLVSPSGRKVVIMSDFGAGAPGVTGINETLDDYAATPVPSTVTGNTGFPFVTGTYRPSNSGTTDVFPAPAPASPYTYTLSSFNGDTPNGTWSLYIIDDANLDGGSISGGWTLTFDVRPPAPTAGQVLVSEFRTRGEGTAPPTSDGSADEFIELYNNTNQSITIIDAIPGADPTLAAGAGWRFSAAQGATESTFLLLPQTLSTAGPLAIPARGHFLVTVQPTTPSPTGNTYSLAAYPTGTGITASGSANVSINPATAAGFLPDDVGLAIFGTANALSANRLDSVGFSSVVNPDYKEGAGLSPATGITTAGQHSFVRRTLANGNPQDTNSNTSDFVLVSTTGTVINGINSILGAPGPERGPTATAFTTSSAPIHDGTANNMLSQVIDPQKAVGAAPNFVYDPTPVTNGSAGTIKLRRKFTNNTGVPLVSLRYRIDAISTLTGGTVPAGKADLRVLNSPLQTITLTDATTVTSQATTVQTPPTQALGGGWNSSLGEGVITTTAPLANGASTIVEFNLGVMVPGQYSFAVAVEGLVVPPIVGVSATFAAGGCAGPASNPGDICLNVTAANVTVGGRVLGADGRGLTNARVTLSDNEGGSRTVVTGRNGRFVFNEVESGRTYVISVGSRRYSYSPQLIEITDNVSDVVFTPDGSRK